MENSALHNSNFESISTTCDDSAEQIQEKQMENLDDDSSESSDDESSDESIDADEKNKENKIQESKMKKSRPKRFKQDAENLDGESSESSGEESSDADDKDQENKASDISLMQESKMKKSRPKRFNQDEENSDGESSESSSEESSDADEKNRENKMQQNKIKEPCLLNVTVEHSDDDSSESSDDEAIHVDEKNRENQMENSDDDSSESSDEEFIDAGEKNRGKKIDINKKEIGEDGSSESSQDESTSASEFRFHGNSSPVKTSNEHAEAPRKAQKVAQKPFSFRELPSIVNESDFSQESVRNHSSVHDDYKRESELNNRKKSKFSSDLNSNSQQSPSHSSYESTDVHSNAQHSPLHSNYESTDKDYHENVIHTVNSESDKAENALNNPHPSTVYNNPTEFQGVNLESLFDSRCKQLIEEVQARKTLEEVVKSLQEEKSILSLSCEKYHKLMCEYRQENSLLKGKLAADQLKITAEQKAKEDAQLKVQSYEIQIKSLEQAINERARSDNFIRLQNQSESVIKDLKERHRKEVLQLKEEIDRLQKNLNNKISELENMQLSQISLQKKFEEFQVEKCCIIQKLSSDLQTSQNQYLQASGATVENGQLKFQVQQLQEANSNLLKQNSSLKVQNNSLEEVLRTYEALNSALDNEIQPEKNRKMPSEQSESSLKEEFRKSSSCVRSLRIQNQSLTKELDELRQKYPVAEEHAKIFESRCKELEVKVKELEKKLEDVNPSGSIPMFQHEKKVTYLKNEMKHLNFKLQDFSEKLKLSSSNEKKLNEEIKHLKSNIAEMLISYEKEKKNDEKEKKKAAKLYYENFLKDKRDAIEKLRQQFSSQLERNLKDICSNHETQISELKMQIESLDKELRDAKKQYVSIYNENMSLHSKIDSISKPKEREEIEREVKSEYKKKLNEELKQYKDQKEHENEKAQREWTEQKTKEVDKFIEKTKEELDEHFKKCLNEEKQKLQLELELEKEKYHSEYKEKVNSLKQKCETEKKDYAVELRENIQLKWKNESKESNKSNQKEIESIRQNLESKILALENEIKILKDNLDKKHNEFQQVQSLKQDLLHQKEVWEVEKLELIKKDEKLSEKLSSALESEKTFQEKKKKYSKYISYLKKKYEEKLNRLKSQNEELKVSIADKEQQVFLIKTRQEETINKLDQQVQKHTSIKHSSCQTEGEVVSKELLWRVRDKFITCIKSIKADLQEFMLNSRKRTTELLHNALSIYHDHLMSKIFQDVIQDARSIVPNSYIPRLNSQSTSSSRDNFISPNVVQHQFNSNFKISNSTPIYNPASGDALKKFDTHLSDVTHAKMYQNIRTSQDSAVRFEDVSFDFMPCNIKEPVYASTKLPQYSMPSGLFNRQNSLNSFPERDSPAFTLK